MLNTKSPDIRMTQFLKAINGFLILAAFLFISQTVFAQPCPPGCPEILPIDGGIGFLIAAGAVYGVKKIRDSRKKGTQ